MDRNEAINENKDTIEEIVNNYQNDDNWNESNNGLNVDESEDKKSLTSKEMVNIDNNSCKVCNNSNDFEQCVCDDISNQFFASGPFYTIENVDNNHINTDNTNHSLHSRERSSKCNVLYAEMPQLPQIALNSDNLGHNKDNNINSTIDENSICCALDSAHSTTSSHLMVDSNYQFLYYNYCRSPLSVCDSQLSDNLFYLSSDDSKVSICGKMDNSQRSSLSSPIMLKFYKENIDHINGNSNKQELNSCSKERLSNYTTVIKPKAVRPQFNSMASNSNTTRNIMSSTLSFHGSTNVLSDSDESAFRQIPRRRSNSEATHHYQSVSHDSSQTPVRTSNEKSRPLHMSERCRSVDKAYRFDNSLDSRKCHTFSDKLKLKTDSNNPNNIYSNRKTLNKSDNYLEISPQQRKSTQQQSEPIHMTLEEVRNIFSKNQSKRCKNSFFMPKSLEKHRRSTHELEDTLCKSKSKSIIKCAFENLFRSKRKSGSPHPFQDQNTAQSEPAIRTSTNNTNDTYYLPNLCANESSTSPFTHRALPPLPNRIQDLKTESLDKEDKDDKEEDERQKFLDYAASIERVKDCGWYWGPISGEMAEKLLASEPCGSFIVRDSSDEHYIFSLTFKLNGLVRHVRIEHDQGNFSFGSLQKFRSNTIVDFIETAVEHSRSGRFLFFLHRRPVMGPMRVQLLHPVSRFKQIQSLQHMCRFVILKHVRRDLIDELPLPKMLKSYLNTPYYYSEELAIMNKNEEPNDSLPLNTSQ